MSLFPRHWSPVESSWRSHSGWWGGWGLVTSGTGTQPGCPVKCRVESKYKHEHEALFVHANHVHKQTQVNTFIHTYININTKMRLWGLGYYESGPDVQVFADSEVLIIFTCATERLLPLCMHCTHTPLSSRGQMHSFCLNFIADFSLICSPLPFLSGPVVIGLLLHTPSVSENEMSRMH